MDNNMKVNIDDIEKITSLLLSKLKESKGNEIEINNDFYWDISEDQLYSPYEEPKNITLGQLSDDLEEVQRLAKSDDAIIYDLKRVSQILKVLSIENPTAF
jgi:hypothetical protein